VGVFIYCPKRSADALALTISLGAKRLRRFDGEQFWDKGKQVRVPQDSTIICWGHHLPDLDGFKILNSIETHKDTYQRFQNVLSAGISTVRVARGQDVQNPRDYIEANYLPRLKGHKGGLDLLGLDNFGEIEYWSERKVFAEEVRIHSFNGKSIRAGKKVVRPGFKLVQDPSEWKPYVNLAHPWVKTYEGGWEVSYDFKSNEQMRSIAHTAVKAIGLTFAAVDIGILDSGTMIVLGFNSAPPIEGTSVQSYTRAIRRWLGTATDPKTQDPTYGGI
jgi:hypothetical protein